jgi:hypothetical protein
MDQIDFTGPFEVLSRMPDTSIQIIGKEVAQVRDVQGLRLSPDVSIAKAGLFDCATTLSASWNVQWPQDSMHAWTCGRAWSMVS